jgi:hypothetical protein
MLRFIVATLLLLPLLCRGQIEDAAYPPSLLLQADLKTTIQPQTGPVATFSRTSAAHVLDQDGILRHVAAGEARFQGARRVFNTLINSDLAGYVANTPIAPNNAGAGVMPASWNIGNNPTTTTTILGVTYTNGIPYLQVRLVTDNTAGGQTQPDILANANFGASGGDYVAIRCAAYYNRVSGTNTNIPYIGTEYDTGGGAYADQGPTIPLSTSPHTYGQLYGTLLPTSSIAYLYIQCVVPAGATDTLDIFFAQPQMEFVTGQVNQNPSEYVPGGALPAPYNGANVASVKYFPYLHANTIDGSGHLVEARGAYISDSTLAGILLEGQRTNVCKRSETFTTASWTKSNITIATGQTGPDAEFTASSFTATANNVTIIQNITKSAATDVFSIYLKRKTGTGNIDLTLDNGTTWTTVPVDATWKRFYISQSVTNPKIGVRIVTNADAVYAYGAQLEIGSSIPSSYIGPTAGSNITRNADVLTYAPYVKTFQSSYSVYAEFATRSSSAGVMTSNDGTLNNSTRISTGAPGIVITNEQGGATDTTLTNAATVIDGNRHKASYSVTVNRFTGAVDNTLLSAVPCTVSTGLSTINIGNFSDGSAPLFGTVRNVKVWNGTLDDGTLRGMTAP